MANSATRRPWGSGGAPAASSGAKATPVRTPKEQLPAGAMAWTQVAAAAGSASPGELPMDRPPPASRADEMSVWEPTTSGSTPTTSVDVGTQRAAARGDLWRTRGPRGPTQILVQRGRGSSSLESGGAKAASPASCGAEVSKRRAGGLPR
jgi:hypothetical protein